jgi:hypothetical protein
VRVGVQCGGGGLMKQFEVGKERVESATVSSDCLISGWGFADLYRCKLSTTCTPSLLHSETLLSAIRRTTRSLLACGLIESPASEQPCTTSVA